MIKCQPASCSSAHAFVSGAGSLKFKSRTGQIGHSVANGSPPLRHFLVRSCEPTGAVMRKSAPPTRYASAIYSEYNIGFDVPSIVQNKTIPCTIASTKQIPSIVQNNHKCRKLTSGFQQRRSNEWIGFQ